MNYSGLYIISDESKSTYQLLPHIEARKPKSIMPEIYQLLNIFCASLSEICMQGSLRLLGREEAAKTIVPICRDINQAASTRE